MFEKGGMKKVIGSPLPQSSPVAASTRNITVDELYGHLGGDSILRTTLDFEEGTRNNDEIVDVNAAEKRKLQKRGNLVKHHNGVVLSRGQTKGRVSH